MSITREALMGQLSYSPETGLFHWLVEKNSHGGKVHVGDKAGHVNERGYVLIGLNGRLHRAHRLAWFYMTGEWPESMIDHKNGVRHDNRWLNLRLSDNSRNGQNVSRSHSDNVSGYLGVSFHKQTGKYVAKIKTPGSRSTYLGIFETPELAHSAYLSAKRELHAACPGVFK